MRITDARQIREQLSIDQQGFELLRRQTRVQDFYSEAELGTVYNRELEQLITELTGAEKVIVFDHTRRVPGRESVESRCLVFF